MERSIRLLVIEDNHLLREGISAVLERQPDFKVIAAPNPSEDVLAKISASEIDVVLLDWGLLSRDSLEVVKLIADFGKDVHVIVMGLYPSHTEVIEFIKYGAMGFLIKDASATDFVNAIRQVLAGQKVLPPALTDSLFTEIINQKVADPREEKKILGAIRMTTQEREVIAMIADGLTNKEIAGKMNVSHFTIKSHVHNILEKLTLHNRLQIAKFAYESDAEGAA